MATVRAGRGWARGLLWGIAGILAGGGGIGAQSPLPLTRIELPIELDGRPDEAAWARVEPLPLTMYFPTFGGTPRERSEIRVAYDDDYLYAAGWFYDSEGEGIRINSLYRDRWNGDDAFAIYVDSFNDNQNAKWFGITPAATRFDILVSDDGATLNGSWDAFWDAETAVTDEGWFVEVRIPFSTLGFQTGDDGRAVMGLTVTRLVSRTGERVTFPAIDPQFPFRQPSVARDVVLEGVESDRPVYVTPFVLGGTSRRAVFDETEGVYETERTDTREVGLDVRFQLAGNLTLDLTANTDFAQVEADDQQINQGRFPLFFPEKRRFFQEGSGVFDFYTGNGNRLFHSRRIGLTDDAVPVPVLGGARMVGRMGDWDVGFLDMQTEARGEVPSENFGALRARRRVFNDFSTVGAMLTSRAGDGSWNVAAGTDGVFRVAGDHYLTVKWAGSFRDDEPDGLDPLDRSTVYVHWQRRVNRALAYEVSTSRTGEAYDPGVGFLQRGGITLNALANYYVYTDDHALFRRVFPGFLAFSNIREHGGLESGQYAVWVQWETKGGSGGWIEPKVFVEDVGTPFRIGGVVDVPADRYVFADLQFAWQMNPGRPLRADIDARAGTFYDGRRAQVILSPTWNVNPRLELGATYQFTHLEFADRDQAADLHLLRFRIRTALDSRASGNAFLQYNSTTDGLDVNVRLRYNFAEGRDLWLVYNEGLLTDRTVAPGEVEPPHSLARSFIVKYSHTWGG